MYNYNKKRYYRAPEIILGEENYGVEIDVWSIGCVIAEMFLGQPIFSGKSSKDQFLKIMNVLGNPSEDDINNMCSNITVTLPIIKGVGLQNILKNVDPELIDLLSKVLAYNPRKRLRPFQALTHSYFDDLRTQRLTINGKSIIDLFDFNVVEIGKDKRLLQKLIPAWYNKKR